MVLKAIKELEKAILNAYDSLVLHGFPEGAIEESLVIKIHEVLRRRYKHG